MYDISRLLRDNPYPGRGIVLGRSGDDRCSVLAYFIMGRSANSRNRVFVRTDDGIRAQAFDPAAMTDPKGILYNPVRRIGEAWVVSNGDQTDAIRDCFAVGRPWEEALRASTFKQDAPDFTPRISGLLYPDGHYALSILKAMEGSPRCCQRSVFDYDVPRAGMGHIIYTYEGDGTPLPSFCGEPRAVTICGSQEDFTAAVWYGLHAENRVSLFTAFIDRRSGEVTTRIVNRNQNLGVEENIMQTDRYISPLSTRYASAEMQYLFSQDFKFRTWRRLWIALARAEKTLGLAITDEQIAELEAHRDDINYAEAEAREREVRHDVMSHVYAYGLQCPKAAGIITSARRLATSATTRISSSCARPRSSW